MHVGVIGLGRMGGFHAGTLHKLSGVTKLTVVDQDFEKAEAIAAKLQASPLPSLSEAIKEGVDAVVIASSTDAHAVLVEESVEAGIPVFCEKPIALDLETTNHIVEKVDNLKVPVQIGFHRRFDAGYVRARAEVQSGRLGRIYQVRAFAHDPAPPHESYIEASGGQYRDLHIHDFDIIPWVTGLEFVEIYAEGSVLVDDAFARHGDVDTTIALFSLSDRVLGTMAGSRHNPLGYDIRMEIYGSRDSIAIGWDARTPLRSIEPGYSSETADYYSSFLDRYSKAYEAEIVEFLRLAKGEIENPCTVKEAATSLRAALTAEQSRREHRPIMVRESHL